MICMEVVSASHLDFYKMNHVDIKHLKTIKAAMASMRDTPSDQWMPFGFFDPVYERSDMIGWYVRTLPGLKGRDFAMMPLDEYQKHAIPFVKAIHRLLMYCLLEREDPVDAYQICRGGHPAFQQSTPKERAMACLTLIIETCASNPLHYKIEPPPPQYLEMRS